MKTNLINTGYNTRSIVQIAYSAVHYTRCRLQKKKKKFHDRNTAETETGVSIRRQMGTCVFS